MTDSEAHYRKMTETPVSRLILNLGIPTTISMLITSIYNMADTYFVGTLGESAQAATGILFTVQAIMQGLAFMLGHGAGTHVSRSLADRDADKATMYISTSFFTGMGLGLVIGVLGLAFLRPLPTACWCRGAVSRMSRRKKQRLLLFRMRKIRIPTGRNSIGLVFVWGWQRWFS